MKITDNCAISFPSRIDIRKLKLDSSAEGEVLTIDFCFFLRISSRIREIIKLRTTSCVLPRLRNWFQASLERFSKIYHVKQDKHKWLCIILCSHVKNCKWFLRSITNRNESVVLRSQSLPDDVKAATVSTRKSKPVVEAYDRQDIVLAALFAHDTY